MEKLRIAICTGKYDTPTFIFDRDDIDIDIVHVDYDAEGQKDNNGNPCEIDTTNNLIIDPEFVEDAFSKAGELA